MLCHLLAILASVLLAALNGDPFLFETVVFVDGVTHEMRRYFI